MKDKKEPDSSGTICRSAYFDEDRIGLSSEIPSGNGGGFERISGGVFKFHIRRDGELFAQFFNIEITSGSPGKITLLAADGIAWGKARFAYTWYEPVISLDKGRTWAPAPDCRAGLISSGPDIGDQMVRYEFTAPSPSFRIASSIPFSLQDLTCWISGLEKRNKEVVSVRSCGKTFGGRDIPVIKVAEPGSCEDGKLRVFIIAGQHPAETEPVHTLRRMIDLALCDEKLLEKYLFEIVPVVNIDGIESGRSYSNLQGINMSASWQDMKTPEILAVASALKDFSPHLFIDMHSGDFPHVFRLNYSMEESEKRVMEITARDTFKDLFGHVKLSDGRGADFSRSAGWTRRAFTMEVPRLPNTLSLFRDNAGHVLNFIDKFLQRLMRMEAGICREAGYRFQLARFIEKLPGFYYTGDLKDKDRNICNFEVNGVNMAEGKYDIYLEIENAGGLREISFDGKTWQEPADSETGLLAAGFNVCGGRISVHMKAGNCGFYGTLAAVPAGVSPAACEIEEFKIYTRKTLLEEKHVFRDWDNSIQKIMSTEMPLETLEEMREDLLASIVKRQVTDVKDSHFGAVYSVEDKYSFRDAACAAAAFMQEYRKTGVREWAERARSAVDYCYKGQQFGVGPEVLGGFGEMGMMGYQNSKKGASYRRVYQDPSIVSGVDSGIIACHLVKAFELGLDLLEHDIESLRHLAVWFENNEYRLGQIRHHQGAVTDCQNSNAIGAAALIRIFRLFESRGLMKSSSWRGIAKRAVEHVLSGQEAIGEWPYIFSGIGRGQKYHRDSIPDQGMGLHHLLECGADPEFEKLIDKSGCLEKIAYWYLLTSRFADDGTITLEYEDNPGEGIGFSCFTWCRFMAVSSISRVWGDIGNKSFWKKFVLSQLKFIKQNLWLPSSEPVPVKGSVVPVKLKSWIHAVEWEAVLLFEIINNFKDSDEQNHGC